MARTQPFQCNMAQPAAPAIRSEHLLKFVNLARQMDRLLADIREYSPGANMYLEDSGNWNLLVGDSHDDREEPRQDRIACSAVVRWTGGGAW